MTIIEFRQDKALVKSAKAIMSDSTLAMMLQIVDLEIRSRKLLPKSNMPDTAHSYWLGVYDGMETYRTALESMGELLIQRQQVKQDYSEGNK